MKAQVRSDFWGRFTIQLSNPKEKMDRCPADSRNHSHQSVDKAKKCFLEKRVMFESSRRIEWQLMLWGLSLTEAKEPCLKRGCFWSRHDME